MKIEYSYPEEFEKLMIDIKGSNGIDLMELDGIGTQTDVNKFSKKFFSKGGVKTTADISVDSNANIEDVTVLQYNSELAKPSHRLNNYFLLWKYGRDLFSTETANKMVRAQLNKEIYINDFHALNNAYCFNFSCMDVVFVGLPFTKKVNSEPAKNLSSFMGQMINFITYAGNNVAGACGVADLLICMSYYVTKMRTENKDIPRKFLDKQVRQEIQSFIYSVNQPFRGGVQSFFTNLTVFDDVFLAKLCNEYQFPNGDKPDITVVKELQVIYMDLMNEVLTKSPATFPVTTAAFAINEKGEVIDKGFLRLVSEKNLAYGFMNIYAGKTSTLSSCPLPGDTEVLVRGDKGIYTTSINNLKSNSYRGDKIELFNAGRWNKAILNRHGSQNIYEVELMNGEIIRFGELHQQPTKDNGTVLAWQLKVSDFLPYNTSSYTTSIGTYNLGFAIGLYMGDGSSYGGLTFSLNKNTDEKISKEVKQYFEDMGFTTKVTIENELLTLRINGIEAASFMGRYVRGTALDKHFTNHVFNLSEPARQGLLDGWYQADGGNSGRIYSFSKKAFSQFKSLCTSLGHVPKLDYIDTREKRLSKNPCYVFKYIKKENFKDSWVTENDKTYVKIKRITKLKPEATYCFEVDNDEQMFVLASGLITHNCRLRNDTSDSAYFNSFGSGSSKVGSIGVVTINLPRLAYISKDREDFLERVQSHTELASRINHVKRYIIKKRIDGGHYPLYSGFMDLKHQYSTCGLVGINEACEILKMDIMTKEGQVLVTDMLDIINKVNSIQEKKYKYPHNTEQVPAENSAIKLAEADRLLGFNKKYALYSNQFIPLISKADLYDRIKLQGLFDKHMTGGAICHLNIVDRITDPAYMERLIEHAISQGVVYFAVNYNLQKCIDGHITVGKNDKCPVCIKEITDNFIRVVGFLVNTKNFHHVRREKDYPIREFYGKEVLK